MVRACLPCSTLKTHIMKGIVFTEFLEMVESKFGIEMVNGLLDSSELASGGVYSAVGT